MSKRCSDVVESRVERAVLDAAETQLGPRIRNSPGALASWARANLTTTRRAEPASL